ncbi:MAG: hypothetical protein ACI3YC_05955 [Alloprevotella sp.]
MHQQPLFQGDIKLVVDELNANGLKDRGKYEYDTFEDDPMIRRLFMMEPINNSKALMFLKSQGLLENGRCPSCGTPMSVYRYTWSDSKEPSKKFYVCYGCCKSNKRGDGHSMEDAFLEHHPSQILAQDV